MSRQNVKKSDIAKKTHRASLVSSTTPERPTIRQNAKAAPRAVVDGKSQAERLADIYAAGGEVVGRLNRVKAELEGLNTALESYRELVSDRGPTLTDREVGANDMAITSEVKDIAQTAVALLLQLLMGRKARMMAVAANDLLVLGELARNCWAAFVRGTAASVLLLDVK